MDNREFWVCGRFLASAIGPLPGEAFNKFWDGFDPQIQPGPRADLWRVNSGQFYTLEYCLDFEKTEIELAIEEVTKYNFAKRYRGYFRLIPAFDEGFADFQCRAIRFTEFAKQTDLECPEFSDTYNAFLKQSRQEYFLGDRQSAPEKLLRHEFHVIADLIVRAEKARSRAVELCLT